MNDLPMKKLLILAYDFPPYVSVGGLRPYNWYKYFNEYHVYPIVVTRQWSNQFGNHLDYIAPGISSDTITEQTDQGTILRSPYKPNRANRLMLKYGEKKYRLLRKFISAWHEFMQWFFITGPKANIYKAADTYLKENKVDVIIATGDPFVLFRYASILSKKYQIPWIADYRDPWSHNHERTKTYLKSFYRMMEKKYVKSASTIVTVSDFLVAKISTLFPAMPFVVLPNGYDPEAIHEASEINPGSVTLKIAFVGTIYEWHPWKSFLKVMDSFCQENSDVSIQLDFYGINIKDEMTFALKNEFQSIQHIVNIHDKMPNQDLLKKLGESHVMLLFNYYSYMGTKIFDYIGMKRLILLCYANDPEALKLKSLYYNIEELEGTSTHLQQDLIEKTNAGIVVQDAHHLKDVMHQLKNEFLKTGKIACNSVDTENYSRKHQVKQLSELIHTISK